MADLEETLIGAGIKLDGAALCRLNRYMEMLIDWNQRMDLTSVPDFELAQKHFLDSLLPLKRQELFPAGCRYIDVGTGAGFPGLALAAAREDLQCTLLEAQGKRCRFLEAVQKELGLENVTVLQDRAETLGRNEAHRERYDRAIARAVAPLNVLCEYLLPFVREGGYALCWKGPAAAEERTDGDWAAKTLGGEIEAFLPMEGENSGHVVVAIKKIQKTLPQYPRKNGIPAKRPLKNGVK